MQIRRPLIADFHTSPCERLMHKFGWRSMQMPGYEQWCAPPRIFFPHVDAIAAVLGFEKTPRSRMEVYPPKALEGKISGRKQHRTTFLQWGWATNPHKQVYVEIADATFMVSMHFLKDRPGDNGTPWHLDTLVVNGQRLSCERRSDEAMVRSVLMCVQGAIANLNDDNWEKAETIFHGTLDRVMREMEDRKTASYRQPTRQLEDEPRAQYNS